MFGAAIECRISAEDPAHNFMPSSGKIEELKEPGGPGVRVDSGIFEGFEIPLFYDPLISKLLVWASTRDEAIKRMRRALTEYKIRGIKTTIPFHEKVMENESFTPGPPGSLSSSILPLDGIKLWAGSSADILHSMAAPNIFIFSFLVSKS